MAALAAVAAVTERCTWARWSTTWTTATRSCCAKAAATIHLLSGGRHEFGIGAGWMETDYVEAGMPYDRPGVRIERLDEALQIIRGMWTQERTSFEGKHYRSARSPRRPSCPEGRRRGS